MIGSTGILIEWNLDKKVNRFYYLSNLPSLQSQPFRFWNYFNILDKRDSLFGSDSSFNKDFSFELEEINEDTELELLELFVDGCCLMINPAFGSFFFLFFFLPFSRLFSFDGTGLAFPNSRFFCVFMVSKVGNTSLFNVSLWHILHSNVAFFTSFFCPFGL